MSKPRTDNTGRVIQIGDIVASFPKSGGYEIAQVTGIFKSGRVTGKVPSTRSIYAYEQGAPDVKTMRTGRRLKPGIRQDYYRWYKPEDYETYEYEDVRKDYTVVGKKRYWQKKQLADISLLVLRTADGADITHLNKDLNIDWTAEVPE